MAVKHFTPRDIIIGSKSHSLDLNEITQTFLDAIPEFIDLMLKAHIAKAKITRFYKFL